MTGVPQLGLELRARALPAITLEQLKLFAEASGDPNEIHLNEEVAKKMGLPGVIAHGMLIASFLSERVIDFMQEGRLTEWRLQEFQTRFKAMTFLGDVISTTGRVKDSSDSEVSLELQAKKQTGETVCTATAILSKKT